MFRKPFKIKSNNPVKGTDRKIVKEILANSFPALTEADLQTFLAKKEVINCVKILTSNDEMVQVYTIQRFPMIFCVRGVTFPTIFLLWKFPELVYAFTTHPQVVSKIIGGADLMLPGVLPLPFHLGVPKYGNLAQNAIAYVNTSTNKAAFAVGVAATDSATMALSGGKGKCLLVQHYFGDRLCSMEEAAHVSIPTLTPPEWCTFKTYEEVFPALGAKRPSLTTQNKQPLMIQEVPAEVATPQEKQGSVQAVDQPMTTEEMDKLLNYCFLTAIKYSKTLVLPVLTSTFFKLQIIPACPEGKVLDLRKTSFKKLKPFLDNMCKAGLIVVKEEKKGVESITSINKNHPKYTEFYLDPEHRPGKVDEGAAGPSTQIVESFIITQNVLPIFHEAGLSKGELLQMTEIKKHVTDFVKNHSLQVETNKRLIKPQDILVKLCKTENNITFEELMERVCEAMKPYTKVFSGQEEIVNKGKLPPISMTVCHRAGNKKVTLVDNLEFYGINICEFAKECQRGVAASTSISKPVGKKCDQLLIQGNQVIYVHSLLTTKYEISQKYIRGMEFAPKKKK